MSKRSAEALLHRHSRRGFINTYPTPFSTLTFCGFLIGSFDSPFATL
jgi:hypothetical protein